MSEWLVSAARTGSYRIRRGTIDEVRGQGLLVLDAGIPRAIRELIAEGWDPERVSVPGQGEGLKDWGMVKHLTGKMMDAKLERREPVIAVGGGALLDVAGFAASVYRRGLPYVRVPTTLLAYVDASVGVKTGINFEGRKNLVGSFAPPSEVILDPELLRTLDHAEVASGMGEIVKLAVGCDPSLLPLLRTARSSGAWISSPEAEPLLDAAIAVMLRELQPNLYEGDLTRAVDLGHTFGIALEMNGMRHGESVALDVLLSAVISNRRGILPRENVLEIIRLTDALGLPTQPTVSITDRELYASLEERRLHRGGDQRVPLPAVLGSCVFADDVTIEEIRAAMSDVWT